MEYFVGQKFRLLPNPDSRTITGFPQPGNTITVAEVQLV